MSKEQISKSYLEETKRKYLRNTAGIPRNAIVVGSNRRNNIGSHIANRLSRTCFEIKEYDENSWHPYDIEYNKYSILVLANGFTHLDWIENQPEETIIKTINDCLTTSIISTKHFVNATINLPTPKYIVYIGSMAYTSVLNGSAIYCAAKAGLAHFAKCVAWELAPKNYNVYCVHPSNTEGTPMTDKTILELARYRDITLPEAREYWGSSLPKSKWLQPGDIADTVDFLVSGRADYLSGSNINMSGGQR